MSEPRLAPVEDVSGSGRPEPKKGPSPEAGKAAGILQFKKLFGYLPKGSEDPLDGPFLKSMLAHRRNRQAIDRSAFVDQLTGESYSALRRGELGALALRSHVAAEYGLRTARNRNALETQPGMRVEHPEGAIYNRDFPPEKMDAQMWALLKAADTSISDSDRGKVVFVNSATAVDKLQTFSGPLPAHRRVMVGPGLHALVFEKPNHVGDMVKEVGATPSSHQVFKLNWVPKEGPALKPDTSIDNEATASKLWRGGHEGLKRLEAVPETHPAHQLASAAAALVTGVAALAAKLPGQDPLIDDALRNLASVTEAMPACLDDTKRFCQLYEIMVDEIYMILATAKPYKARDFKDTANVQLAKRAPSTLSLKAKVSGHLVSSGMDAMSTALQAALKATGAEGVDQIAEKDGKVPDYFEIQGLLEHDGKLKQSGPVMTAILNPSLPTTSHLVDAEERWDGAALVRTVKEKLSKSEDPMVLVLDATVEVETSPDGRSDLDEVVKALKEDIESGKLKLVLCKSYQKYPSLGSAKIMAGGVTVIGKDDPTTAALTKSVGETETDLAWMEQDESQLLVHLMKQGDSQEMPMMAKASEGALFVSQMCVDGTKGKFEKGLPFVGVPTKVVSSRFDDRENASLSSSILPSLGLGARDSFAFLETTFLQAPVGEENGVRITVGQESQAELTEMLYALGYLLEHEGEPYKVGSIETEVDEALKDCVKQILERGRLEKIFPDEKERTKAIAALTTGSLADRMKAVAQFVGPKSQGEVGSEDDIHQVLSSMTKGWRHPASEGSDPPIRGMVLPNILASHLVMADAMFQPTSSDGTDGAKLAALYDTMIETEMAGVSPSCRDRLAANLARMERGSLADRNAERRKQAIDRIVGAARCTINGEGRGKILKDGLGEADLQGLDAEERTRLVRGLVDGLDLGATMVLGEQLLAQGSFRKLSPCLASMRQAVKRARDGEGEVSRSETVGTIGRKGSDLDREVDDAARALEDLAARTWTALLESYKQGNLRPKLAVTRDCADLVPGNPGAVALLKVLALMADAEDDVTTSPESIVNQTRRIFEMLRSMADGDARNVLRIVTATIRDQGQAEELERDKRMIAAEDARRERHV